MSPDQDRSGKQGAERRTSPRYPVDLDVEIEWGSATLKGHGRDIGISGLFITTPEPLWLNARFAAKLLAESPILLDCVVRRIEPGIGMGVQIAPSNDDARLLLVALIESLAARLAARP